MLRGGQSLSVRLDGSRVVATTQPTLAARAPAAPDRRTVPVPPAVEAPPPPDSTGAHRHAPRRARAPASPPARWSERLADGDAAGIVAEAQRRGIANVLAGGQQRGPGGARGRRPLSQAGRAGAARAARPAPSVPGDVAGRGGVVPAGAARRRPRRSRLGRARLVRPLPARSPFRSLCRRGDGADDAGARAAAADRRGACPRGGVPAPVPQRRVRPSRPRRGFAGPVNDRGAGANHVTRGAPADSARRQVTASDEGRGLPAFAFAALALAPAAATAVAPPRRGGRPGDGAAVERGFAAGAALFDALREELAAGGFEVTVSEFGAGGEALWMVDPPSPRDGSIATIALDRQSRRGGRRALDCRRRSLGPRRRAPPAGPRRRGRHTMTRCWPSAPWSSFARARSSSPRGASLAPPPSTSTRIRQRPPRHAGDVAGAGRAAGRAGRAPPRDAGRCRSSSASPCSRAPGLSGRRFCRSRGCARSGCRCWKRASRWRGSARSRA